MSDGPVNSTFEDDDDGEEGEVELPPNYRPRRPEPMPLPPMPPAMPQDEPGARPITPPFESAPMDHNASQHADAAARFARAREEAGRAPSGKVLQFRRAPASPQQLRGDDQQGDSGYSPPPVPEASRQANQYSPPAHTPPGYPEDEEYDYELADGSVMSMVSKAAPFIAGAALLGLAWWLGRRSVQEVSELADEYEMTELPVPPMDYSEGEDEEVA